MAEPVEYPEAVVVAGGRIETLGIGSVAVFGIARSSLTARLGVAGSSTDFEWETLQTVRNGQEVLGSGSRYRVVAILVGLSGDDRGSVSLRLIPGANPWPRNAVVLAGDGPGENEQNELLLDGPDREHATELRVTQWLPDEQHATAAQVAWYPAKWGREFTLPADIHSVRLEAGVQMTFGSTPAKVLAVQGASADHCARVILELQPRSPAQSVKRP